MRLSGGHSPRPVHSDPSSSSACSSSSRSVRCCALAQRSQRRGLQVTTPPSYHLSLAEQQPEVEEASTSGSSSGAASLYAAELGMRLNLRRLEALFGSSRREEEEGGNRGLADEGDASVPASWFLVTLEDKPQRTKNQEKTPDYFANVGDAIRTLREDIPSLFERDLNYSIYRDDILFKDPRNSFQGMKNYQLIFWSLRFHGRIFFSKLYVEVKRIWQPPNEDGIIKMRWTVHGIPRVPWEAEGTFDGISTYKLDKAGKVYEHIVDNVLLRDPPMLRNPLLAGLNLAPMQPDQTPQLGAWFREQPEASVLPRDTAAAAAAPSAAAASSPSTHWLAHVTFSWVRLYASLLGTVRLTAGLTAGLFSLGRGAGGSSSSSAGHELQEAPAAGSS